VSKRKTIPQIGRKDRIIRKKAVLEEERLEDIWTVRMNNASKN
jgi:hypothetical protein